MIIHGYYSHFTISARCFHSRIYISTFSVRETYTTRIYMWLKRILCCNCALTVAQFSLIRAELRVVPERGSIRNCPDTLLLYRFVSNNYRSVSFYLQDSASLSPRYEYMRNPRSILKISIRVSIIYIHPYECIIISR